MATTQIAARTLPAGGTIIGPVALAVGEQAVTLEVDGRNASPALPFWMGIEITTNRGTTWRRLAHADFTGDWFDRLSVRHHECSLVLTLGTAITDPGWFVRGLIETATDLAIPGGALTVT